jgi:hypothetical protein
VTCLSNASAFDVLRLGHAHHRSEAPECPSAAPDVVKPNVRFADRWRVHRSGSTLQAPLQTRAAEERERREALNAETQADNLPTS